MSELAYYIQPAGNQDPAQVQGPFDVARIQGWVDEGRVKRDMEMSVTGEQWVLAEQVPALTFAPSAPPPAPPQAAPRLERGAGRRPTRRRAGVRHGDPKPKLNAIGPLAASIVLLISPALPWAVVFEVHAIKGYDGDGQIVGALALIMLILCVLTQVGAMRRGGLITALVLGYIVGLVHVIDFLHIQDLSRLAKAGSGMYLGLLASLAAVVTGHLALMKR